jgi:O-antigen biosynthesis protein WbqV
VNPSSVMGATKRLAERYVVAGPPAPGATTRLSMVRFGNVLGSACSVLPIWSSQLAAGRPA